MYRSDASGATDAEAVGPSLGEVVILLLGVGAIALGLRQWRGRPKPGEDAPMPAWMRAVDAFTPARALGFGFLLSALNPKNLGLAAAAGIAIDAAVAAGGDARALVILFTFVSAMSIAIPVLYALVGGEGARRTLEGWRVWLAANNAAVMAVLFLVIGAKLVGSGLDAILG